MKFSTKTRYGLRAMLEIAKGDTLIGVLQKDISQKQDISNKYLDHIIHALKAAQLIANIKGRKSGYILTRVPSEITILDIHNAFERGICVIECLEDTINCERVETCQVLPFWKDLNHLVLSYFKNTTLEDLLKQECENTTT